MSPTRSPLDLALDRVASGAFIVDVDRGLVQIEVTTSIYSYVRPVGFLKANGYVGIAVGARVTVFAHRLIWAVANGVPPAGMLVNHIDGVKYHNGIGNLELVSPAENVRHAIATGLIRVGADDPRRRITDDQAAACRAMVEAGTSQSAVARRFGVSESLVSMIVHNRGRFAAASL
jgi:hypothetical protein